MPSDTPQPDLRLADPRFGDDAVAAVAAVLASGHLTQGPQVQRFEREIAAYCGVGHAVATTSATTALQLALAALDIGPGDEVVVADFTYPATGNAVLDRGATLRLVDVEPTTYTIDPAALAAVLSPATRLVIPVDAFGLPADYTAVAAALASTDVPVLCDAACALGASFGDTRCGALGTASCFSFHPRKVLTTGEGGMVTTDDEGLAERMRRLRNHGSERTGWRASFVEPGFNYRMTDIQAALGLTQVPHHDQVVERRRNLAAMLSEALASVPGVTPPVEPPGRRHCYQAYVAFLDEGIDRDELIGRLRARGIESTLGTYALHAEPAFRERCGTTPGDLPGSWACAERTLALPLHQHMTEGDVGRVADAVRAAISL